MWCVVGTNTYTHETEGSLARSSKGEENDAVRIEDLASMLK